MLFKKKIPKQFVITIPDPCNEVWKEMKVVDSCHRHCAACDRVLTDFSVMSDDELILFFRQSQGKVCGRFRGDQLNRPLSLLPEKTTKANWWKAALLLPFTLFSKSSSAQQLPVDSTKTEQVPYMVALPDSAPPIVINTNWNWHDNEEGPHPWGDIIVMGGVPMIYEWPPLCVTTVEWTIVAAPDTIPKPPFESHVGIQAASGNTTKKLPLPNSAQLAQNFGRANHNDEKHD